MVLAPAGSAFAADMVAASESGSDLLVAEPVDPAGSGTTPSAVSNAPAGLESEPAAATLLSPNFGQTRVLLPYYISAYVPPVDKTEIDLGLLLSQTPGIDVSLSWGAMNELMLAAKISALGASSLVGLSGRYLLLSEWPGASKPAIALSMQWLFVNLRTLDEIRQNIFRGNRLQAGAVFSKDLGALAQSLDAASAVQRFFSVFRLHAQVLAEFQTGRRYESEEAVSRPEFGARAGLEARADEGRIIFYLIYDTLPDWPEEQNYYLGVRYFSQPDLAFDGLIGRLQNANSLILSLAWIF